MDRTDHKDWVEGPPQTSKQSNRSKAQKKSGEDAGSSSLPATVSGVRRVRADAHKSVAWVVVESHSIDKVTKQVRKELKRLQRKISSERVHKARVALRHWSALWSVLRVDGWESDHFQTAVNKPLKKLLITLGAARDADINVELGKKIKVSHHLLGKWKEHRHEAQEQLQQCMGELNVLKVRKKLKRFARCAPKVVSKAVKQSRLVDDDPQAHFNSALDSQEQLARSLAESAATPQEYHSLRLALKQWRYILEDIYGAAQDDLESAQAKLGELHDCDRVREKLIGADTDIAALANLNQKRRELLKQVTDIGASLPFGFRPKLKGKGN
jgi:CHAD domain-containing protein